MKTSISMLCTLAVFLAVPYPAHAQRMPQDNWYHHDDWEGGTTAGFLSSPGAVAVGPDGNAYVAEAQNHRIQVFQQDGTFVRKWGSQGGGGLAPLATSGPAVPAWSLDRTLGPVVLPITRATPGGGQLPLSSFPN